MSKADKQDYVGIGNTLIKGFSHSVQLKLSSFDSWITIDAGFIDENEMPLLGHSGFFENFEITFKAGQERFEITKSRRQL